MKILITVLCIISLCCLRVNSASNRLELKRGKILGVVPTLSLHWSISFKLTIVGTVDSWGNVLHLSLGSDKTLYGDRTPAIWLLPGSTALYIASSVNSNMNYGYTTKEFSLNTPIFIEIAQVASGALSAYQIKINNVQVLSVTNFGALEFEQVKVFASDPWYTAANAYLTDFKFVNMNDEIQRNSVIEQLIMENKAWSLAFSVKLTGISKTMASVIQITPTGLNENTPAAFTLPGSTRMMIVNVVNGKEVKFITPELPMGQFVKFFLQQALDADNNYVFHISIDGKVVFKTINKMPRVLTTLTAYSGNPTYPAAKAVLEGFKFLGL